KRSRSKCCAIAGRRLCTSFPRICSAARSALPRASFSAFTRSAVSEREENCETTVAVETAATSANAAPSHQRTPMNRLDMPEGYAGEAQYAGGMPEGDALHRAAAKLQLLVGQRVEVETPHPRAAAKHIAERLDGHTLESVEAVGKNLLLRFAGGLVLRSHLRMTGRWRVEQKGARRVGTPWLVLRGDTHEAVLWNGPVLELARDPARLRRLGPDILEVPPDLDAMLERLRDAVQGREVGEALLDQTLVAGIGNMWKAEALWDVRVSPWATLAGVSD